MSRPISLEALEGNEDAWLESGEGDTYGMQSFFIHKHYSEKQKQELWSERGDKKRFRWNVGMQKPEVLK